MTKVGTECALRGTQMTGTQASLGGERWNRRQFSQRDKEQNLEVNTANKRGRTLPAEGASLTKSRGQEAVGYASWGDSS